VTLQGTASSDVDLGREGPSGTGGPHDEAGFLRRGGDRGEGVLPDRDPGRRGRPTSPRPVGRSWAQSPSRYGFASESCPRMAPSGNGRLWMFT
jgi:hypothetical protein